MSFSMSVNVYIHVEGIRFADEGMIRRGRMSILCNPITHFLRNHKYTNIHVNTTDGTSGAMEQNGAGAPAGVPHAVGGRLGRVDERVRVLPRPIPLGWAMHLTMQKCRIAPCAYV